MKFKKLLIFIIVLTGCLLVACDSNALKQIKFKDTENFQTLTNTEITQDDYQSLSLDSIYRTSITNFTDKTIRELFKRNINYIYSPTSLYIALSILLEGCENETYEELASLLGVSNLEQLREINDKIYKVNNYYNSKGEMSINNSLWIANSARVKDEYVDVISKKYYAEAFNVNFSAPETNENIVKWINNYTRDLLQLTPKNYYIPVETILLIVNTIYFDNRWLVKFVESDTFEQTFYGVEDVIVPFMTHEVDNAKYNSNDDFITAVDYFSNEKKITYILPNEDSSVSALLDKYSLSEMTNIDKQTSTVKFIVPKFKYGSEFNLNDCIKELGVNKIFSNETAELTKIRDELFVSLIKQNAFIELNEEGVKAAAATSIWVDESVDVATSVILNRPFIYVISDINDIPLFVGIVNNPKV